MTTQLNRRHALAGAAAAGLGVPLLAACGADAEPGGDARTSASETPSGTASEGASEPAAGGDRLASTSDIPEGGGRVFPDQRVVVTQPEAGDFKAFSAVCTHQGCLVADVTDTINCTCHGSRFSLTDGSPLEGPAGSPLGAQEITVEGDAISLS